MALNEKNNTTMVTPLNSNGYSFSPSINNDGKWVSYQSSANNLVVGDTNGFLDVFLYDVVNNITTMVNPLNSNGGSESSSISGDGNWISYQSTASNLVVGDTNEKGDIFLYDVANNITIMVNPLNSDGFSTNPSISSDGRWIAYESLAGNLVVGDINEQVDVFLYDVVNNITKMVNPLGSNGVSYGPSISGDGRWISYVSGSSDIVGNDTNGVNDVFLYDVVNNITTMVSPLYSNGFSYSPVISDDGRWISYYSNAINLVEGDTNWNLDVFLYDVVKNVTIMVNPLKSDGFSINPSISSDGRWIAYESLASNVVEGDTNGLQDVFLYDVVKNVTIMVNPLGSNGVSYGPSISGDGRWIAYESLASNVVEGDTYGLQDIFLFSLYLGENNTTTPNIEQNNTTIPIKEINNTTIPHLKENNTIVKALDEFKETGLPFNYVAIILLLLGIIALYKK